MLWCGRSIQECNYRLPVTVLGQPVVFATDHPRIAEILADTYSSSYFAASPSQPLTGRTPGSRGTADAGSQPVEFRCITRCVAPWVAAFDIAGRIHLARRCDRDPDQFDVFRCSDGVLVRDGYFTYDVSYEAPTLDTTLELFAAHFQRRALRALLEGQDGIRLVHAGTAAVGERGVVILAGTRGGKSTLTLACVVAGMQYLSDDLSVLDAGREQVIPFPRAVRLRRDTCELVPELWALCSGTTVDVRGEPRYYVRPDDIRAGAVSEGAALSHVIVIEGFGAAPSLAPASQAHVAGVLTEADCFATGEQAPGLVWRWGGALDGVPCWSLVAGPPMATAAMVRDLAERSPDATR